MGNFEKVVVLIILLVCVIVLSISLRSPEVEASSTPTSGTAVSQLDQTPLREQLADRQRVATPVIELSGALEAKRPKSLEPKPAKQTLEKSAEIIDPLLNSMVRTSDGRDLALVTTEGLLETVSPDFMIYTCKSGDSWASLSQRFYGDVLHLQLLLNANEGLDQVISGDQILVPAYELRLEPAEREPAQPRAAATTEAGRKSAAQTYTVQSGDSLSGISTKMYGTGSRWMQIFDANRNILDDADSLKVGQTLQIP